MTLGQHGHRAGPLKQTNKTHKTGRHRSKGSISNTAKGRISVKVVSKKNRLQMKKEQRRNQASQIRKNKREEMFARKRTLGGTGSAPFLVGILPLNLQIDPNSALSMIEKCDPEAIIKKTASGVTHITIPRFKQRFSFIIPSVGRGRELNVLDCLKVCDTTILLVSASFERDDILDKWGQKILNMSIAQGLPTPIISLMDLESINPKRRSQTKADIQKLLQKSLPEEKPMTLDTDGDAMNLLRRIGGQKKNVIYNKANRPHMLAECVEYISDGLCTDGILQVTGYLRGQSLNVNQLVHIPGLGDFQMSQIELSPDPNQDSTEGHGSLERKVLDRADPVKQEPLVKENIPDSMDAEQTWPTEEEIAQSNQDNKKMVKKIPKGMSDYQAAWIPEVEIDEDDDDDDEDDDEDDDDDEFMSCESNYDSAEGEEGGQDDEEEEFDTVSVSEAPVNDDKYDQEMDMLEEQETLDKIKSARTDAQWPDEIDTPRDKPARIRFQKYRGLESFRTSPWDIKENLPLDYARIFQFKNFDRTKRRVLKEAKENTEGAQPGWYITVSVKNVNLDLWTLFKTTNNTETLVLYGMLPHEQQMSVMNVVLKRTPDSTVPIKSKERMIIQCGYRRFIVNPVFSQHTNGAKHKYERFFRDNAIVVATFFAPIQFPPAPVICFRENPDTTLGMVATGSLLSCTPDRIVLKRAVLSGHPFKINRKSATVRYMFFNKEDVLYFAPIKLRTRCGRMGHIKESLGTHGHMKCVFDNQLKSYDTVFMYLYKRVFPKWTYEECIVTSSERQPERQRSIGNETDVAME